MNDLKNLTLAWISSASSLFTAIETKTLITVTSAIILPIIFFALGKTVDALLQIYLSNRDKAQGTSRSEPKATTAMLSEPRAVATGSPLNDKGGRMKDEKEREA
jgi:hypothetical protein